MSPCLVLTPSVFKPHALWTLHIQKIYTLKREVVWIVLATCFSDLTLIIDEVEEILDFKRMMTFGEIMVWLTVIYLMYYWCCWKPLTKISKHSSLEICLVLKSSVLVWLNGTCVFFKASFILHENVDVEVTIWLLEDVFKFAMKMDYKLMDYKLMLKMWKWFVIERGCWLLVTSLVSN